MMNRFEEDLRKELKRRSRWKNHDESILEVSQHYQDICDEYLKEGATGQEATSLALSRIGNVQDIARRISTPTSRDQGVKYQWTATALWLFFVFSPLLLSQGGYEIGSHWGNFIEFWGRSSDGAVLAAGIFLAFGIFRAKRWVVSASIVGALLIPLGWIGYNLMTFKTVARHDAWMKKGYDNLVGYVQYMKPAFFERQNLVKACLETPAEQNVEALSAAMHDKPLNGFHIQGDKSGKWVYSTSFQNLRPEASPVIYFATTNSLDQAVNAWGHSDRLRNIMPKMTTRAIEHFNDFNRMDYNRMTLTSKTIDFTRETLTNFAVSTGVGLLACGLFAAASKWNRPRRRQQVEPSPPPRPITSSSADSRARTCVAARLSR